MEVVFLLVTLFLVFLFVYGLRKEHLFSLISFFFIFIILLYIIVPSIDILVFGKQVNEMYPLLIFISFASLCCGVYFGGRALTFKSTVLIKLKEKKEMFLLYFLLAFSLFSLFIYIQSFGGLMAAMINGAKLRYKVGETQSLGAWGFLLFFVALAKIVSCVSFYRLLSGGCYRKQHWLLFILGFSAVMVYALVNASRGSIVLTVLMFIYAYFYYHVQKPESNVTRKVVISCVVVLPLLFIFIVYGKVLISKSANYIETGNFDFSFEQYEGKREAAGSRFIVEFSHAYESADYLITHDSEFNFFKHFLTAPLNIIPSRLFNMKKPPRITELNTKNISGDPDLGRPPGLIASFWYGGGVYSIAFALFIYAFILVLFQKHAEKLMKINPLLTPYFIFIFFNIPWQSGNGDPSIILKSNVYLLVFIFIFYCFMLFPSKFNWQGRRLKLF